MVLKHSSRFLSAATGLLLSLVLISCGSERKPSSTDPVNWLGRKVELPASDSGVSGTSYLPVYSKIYSGSEHTSHELTVTVSIRNLSVQDTVYVSQAEYHDTHGDLVREYLPHPIWIAPMETVEIVVDQADSSGGSGGSFIFGWHTPPQCPEPLFESVMISTSGQQGISFTSRGIRIME